MNQRTATPESTQTCFLGADCTWIGPGHAMAFAQDQIAFAEKEGWRDSVVESVSRGGWITLAAVDDSTRQLVWSHANLLSALRQGDPVAIHDSHHVLASGPLRINVLVI